MYKEKKRIYIIIIIIREHVKKFHVYNNFILFFFEIFITNWTLIIIIWAILMNITMINDNEAGKTIKIEKQFLLQGNKLIIIHPFRKIKNLTFEIY